jgi:hypothetical protein
MRGWRYLRPRSSAHWKTGVGYPWLKNMPWKVNSGILRRRDRSKSSIFGKREERREKREGSKGRDDIIKFDWFN